MPLHLIWSFQTCAKIMVSLITMHILRFGSCSANMNSSTHKEVSILQKKNFRLDGWTVDWDNEIGFAPEYLYEHGVPA